MGENVAAGSSKRIVWDALSEYEKIVGENFAFKIRSGSAGQTATVTVNGISFEMIKVEGGTFTMGGTNEQGSDAYDNEKPTHQVTLSSYYIGKYEVTQKLWTAVMGSNPSWFKGDNRPVENVSWNDCQKFISKLSSLTGKKFAMPTEAQWEFAARGGSKSKGYKYSGSSSIESVAWYTSNSESQTHDVGIKQPNELGIYDMCKRLRDAVSTKNQEKTFAVIIANENYLSESSVPFAINDGSTFKQYCEKTLGIPSSNIRFSPNASYGVLRNDIDWLRQVIKSYNGNAKVIFYYAGHGIPDEANKTAYLLPVDGAGNSFRTGYKLEELYSMLNEYPSKSVTVFLDACFSGTKREGGMLAKDGRGIPI